MHNQPICQTDTKWVTDAPYTAMLTEYRAAYEQLKQRIDVLKTELSDMQQGKAGTYASAQAQAQLERRIQILREERSEITDVIRSILPYAEQEVQS